jgi:hypothetical protein
LNFIWKAASDENSNDLGITNVSQPNIIEISYNQLSEYTTSAFLLRFELQEICNPFILSEKMFKFGVFLIKMLPVK